MRPCESTSARFAELQRAVVERLLGAQSVRVLVSVDRDRLAALEPDA